MTLLQPAARRSTLLARPTLTPLPARVLARQCSCGNHSTAGRQCDECRRAHGSLQRKADGERTPNAVPSIVHDALRTTGRPLDADVVGSMQPRFGRDLGNVRIHTDGLAAESARAVDAQAYTVGHNIVFGANRYEPGTTHGQRLLAHEIAHTIQQNGAPSHASLEISDPRGAAEQQADAAASNVVSGRAAAALTAGEVTAVQRAPVDEGAKQHSGSRALPYREATDLSECTRIMGSENLEYCRREVLGEKVEDAPLPVRATRVADDLAALIPGAVWKEIRKRAYPRESAAGVQRAKDRKTGKLPDLTGLGKISSLEHFAGQIRDVQRHWDPADATKNVTALGNAANAELAAADVPGFIIVDKAPMEFKGFFTPGFWSFTISEALVTSASLNDADAAEVANTTLHESRHAEQDFLAARFAAAMPRQDADTIHFRHGIPTTIAQKAVDKKFDASTDPKVKALGRDMFDATVTHGTANQRISNDDGLADLALRKADAESALTALRARVTQTTYNDAITARNSLRAQIAEVERLYKLYRNIPYEADAHEVGDAAEQAFKGWP
jgi:hypothetical protein